MIEKQRQEQELLAGYRKLKPETKRRIMDTVITALAAESAVKRQYELPPEEKPEPERLKQEASCLGG